MVIVISSPDLYYNDNEFYDRLKILIKKYCDFEALTAVLLEYLTLLEYYATLTGIHSPKFLTNVLP
jgi:hypothetical protein